VSAADGQGTEYELELTEVRPDAVTGEIVARRRRPREPRHRVALAQAMLKGDKLAQVCEQAAELGVSEFIPVKTSRTIGRLSPSRVQRLRGVALSGMKSSTGSALVDVRAVSELDELATVVPSYDQALVAYEDDDQVSLDQVLRPDAGSVLLVIGPEGGFEAAEIAGLRQAGVTSFSMGPRRLRAETAGITAVVMAMQLLGDLSPYKSSVTTS
jgi:16S rRNA (uracil1498-N3)-methyltransferase